MMPEAGEISSAQKDGSAATIVASGHAPGESGVSVFCLHYQGSAHFEAQLRQHLISFVSQTRINCRLAGEVLCHDAPEGSLAICPAGADTSADANNDLNSILIAVEPEKLAVAAAENGTLKAQLIDRLSGHDQSLLDLARMLAGESKDGYPRGTIFWNEAASRFIDSLAIHHTVGAKLRANGLLDRAMFKRLKEFIVEHLDEPLDVSSLARMANRSQFHFSRAFARSIGVSPYRYVVHLRTQRAVDLVREGRLGLAEIAAKTGFADQSHLSRWIRRVHGVSPTRLLPRRAAE